MQLDTGDAALERFSALDDEAGRAALHHLGHHKSEEFATPPPSRPFLIMNPRSGGGKVARFDLDERARKLGATLGRDATAMLANYYADFVFVGAGAISPGGWLMDYTREEGELHSMMLQSARTAVVVADAGHSAFEPGIRSRLLLATEEFKQRA